MDQDYSLLWEEILANLRKTVSKAEYLTFVKRTQLLSLEEGKATIAAPSTMLINFLQKKGVDTHMQRLLSDTLGDDVTLEFVVKAVLTPISAPETAAGPLFQETPAPKPLTHGHLPRVRPDYTFGTFAVSGSNQMAFTAAETVAKHFGSSYNPLFLYGPVGVGKTHLMHAIANSVYSSAPDKKIIYITSEEFTNEVVEAIRSNDTARMKRRFRTASLLLIDDIQFIEGKKAVQEEIFHTFNTLIDQGSQIALSSDRPPQEIKNIMDRLSSRFAGGLTVDIEAPDFELKTAILQKKAEKYGHELPIEAAKILADSATDTRSLEGYLLRVITGATMNHSSITVDLARQAVGQAAAERRGTIHTEDIIKAVCTFYGVKPTQLKSKKRDASLVKARQVCMYLLKNTLALPYVEIGNQLGGRDHTTVMHGVEKITDLVEKEASVTEDIRGISQTLTG